MAYYYSDPSREGDPNARPDVEVFYHSEADEAADHFAAKAAGVAPSEWPGLGFYYAFGFPGCLWDSDPVGPFDSEAEALEAARAEFSPLHLDSGPRNAMPLCGAKGPTTNDIACAECSTCIERHDAIAAAREEAGD